MVMCKELDPCLLLSVNKEVLHTDCDADRILTLLGTESLSWPIYPSLLETRPSLYKYACPACSGQSPGSGAQCHGGQQWWDQEDVGSDEGGWQHMCKGQNTWWRAGHMVGRWDA